MTILFLCLWAWLSRYFHEHWFVFSIIVNGHQLVSLEALRELDGVIHYHLTFCDYIEAFCKLMERPESRGFLIGWRIGSREGRM